MTVRRDTPPAAQNFTKRRSVEANRALIDAAHRATHRLYCDALRLWRRCPARACRPRRRSPVAGPGRVSQDCGGNSMDA